MSHFRSATHSPWPCLPQVRLWDSSTGNTQLQGGEKPGKAEGVGGGGSRAGGPAAPVVHAISVKSPFGRPLFYTEAELVPVPYTKAGSQAIFTNSWLQDQVHMGRGQFVF